LKSKRYYILTLIYMIHTFLIFQNIDNNKKVLIYEQNHK